MPTRESVFQALVELSANVTWGSGSTFQNNVDNLALRRRVKLFNEANVQPALYQAEHDEEVAQLTNMRYKRVWKASWIIYQQIGKDKNAVPTIENNLILDAIEAAFVPPATDPGFPQRLTLGNLVNHCYLDGDIFKDPGDIDDQAMMVVPITILVP